MSLLKGLERNLPQMKSDVMRMLQLILTKFERILSNPKSNWGEERKQKHRKKAVTGQLCPK